jgi:hypothetical protein
MIMNDSSLSIPKPIYLNEKYGYISNGKVIVSPQFDYGDEFSEGLARVIKDDQYGFINTKGEIFIPIQFDYVSNFYNGLAVIFQNKKYGFINTKGEMLYSPQFDFDDDYKTWWEDFDEEDDFIPYENLPEANFKFLEGVEIVKKGQDFFVINLKGELSFLRNTDNFDKIKDLSEGFAKFKKDNQWGFINTKGEIIIESQFDYVEKFKQGFAVIVKDNKYGFINTQGKVVITPQFDDASSFTEGLAYVKDHKNKKYGFINSQGKFIIPPQFDYASDFEKGLANVVKDNDSYSIDSQGKIVITSDDTIDIPEGLALVKEDNKWGFINSKKESIIAPQFDDANYFSEGLAEVKKDDKWGFIDTKGNTVIPFQFDFACSFEEGLAKVEIFHGFSD